MEALPCQKGLKVGAGIQRVTFLRFRHHLITSPIFLTFLGRKLSNDKRVREDLLPQAA